MRSHCPHCRISVDLELGIRTQCSECGGFMILNPRTSRGTVKRRLSSIPSLEHRFVGGRVGPGPGSDSGSTSKPFRVISPGVGSTAPNLNVPAMVNQMVSELTRQLRELERFSEEGMDVSGLMNEIKERLNRWQLNGKS